MCAVSQATTLTFGLSRILGNPSVTGGIVLAQVSGLTTTTIARSVMPTTRRPHDDMQRVVCTRLKAGGRILGMNTYRIVRGYVQFKVEVNRLLANLDQVAVENEVNI